MHDRRPTEDEKKGSASGSVPSSAQNNLLCDTIFTRVIIARDIISSAQLAANVRGSPSARISRVNFSVYQPVPCPTLPGWQAGRRRAEMRRTQYLHLPPHTYYCMCITARSVCYVLESSRCLSLVGIIVNVLCSGFRNRKPVI
jgi:hypothetical protein